MSLKLHGYITIRMNRQQIEEKLTIFWDPPRKYRTLLLKDHVLDGTNNVTAPFFSGPGKLMSYKVNLVH